MGERTEEPQTQDRKDEMKQRFNTLVSGVLRFLETNCETRAEALSVLKMAEAAVMADVLKDIVKQELKKLTKNPSYL